MTNVIITKNSSTVSDVPTAGQLVEGELAVNTNDEKLYSKNASTVFEIAPFQTSIVGITGTMAQFDTAVTDGNIAYAGGGYHDGFSDFVTEEHIRWDLTGAGTIHTDNYIENATHTGQVTGSGVLTMVVAAITGQTDIGANLVGTDEIIVSDAGVIRRADISRFNNYFDANLNFNNYTHPSHPGDDFSVDSGALSGATIISDIDINVTTDAEGHVTDANGFINTRELTAGDIGAATSGHTHTGTTISDLDTSDTTSGTFINARISQGSVTQHEAALTILESQITNANILARIAGTEVITGAWTFDSTHIGKTTVSIETITTGNWDKVQGYSRMVSTASTGEPAGSSHGYYFITGRRDTAGGYGAIWQEYSSGRLWSGYNTTGGDPTWLEIANATGAFHDGFSDYVSQEHIRWDLTGAGTIHTDNYIENATHTGQVTGSGVLTMVVAAITGQTDIGANLVGTDEIIVSDAGSIRRADISRFNNYFNANLSFNNYTHPSHPGDDFSVDSGALANAFVISDIDINITTDTEGHVTDANATIATRQLTAGDIGAEPADTNLTKDNVAETITVTWKNTAQPQMDFGIGGSYSDHASSSFGATMWSIDESWQGATAGTDSASTNVYGTRWLRGSHTEAISDVGEGIYIYTVGVQRGGIGASGIQTDGVLQVNGNADIGGGLDVTGGALTLSTVLDEIYGGTGQSSLTTGNLLYASSTNVLAKRAIGSTDDVLTVSGGVPVWSAPAGPSGGPVNKVKTDDTVKTTDIVLADDPHLHSWDLDASSYYKVTGLLHIVTGASTIPNFRFAFDFSENPTLDQRRLLYMGTDDTNNPNLFHDSASISDAFTIDINASKNVAISLIGYFESNQSTGGDVSFQWSQGGSSGFSTTLKDGSWITIEKIS